MPSYRTAPRAYGRKPTNTEAKRRWRAGNGPGKTGGTRFVPVWETAPPNGLAGPSYRYQGSGRDAYDGSDLFEEGAAIDAATVGGPFCAPPEWHHELDDAPLPAGGA